MNFNKKWTKTYESDKILETNFFMQCEKLIKLFSFEIHINI